MANQEKKNKEIRRGEGIFINGLIMSDKYGIERMQYVLNQPTKKDKKIVIEGKDGSRCVMW
jgi:hypothetical protein